MHALPLTSKTLKKTEKISPMTLPTGVAFFHILAIVISAVAFCITLKTHNDAAQWNKCAPTLRVNHCPIQPPEDTFKCQTARLSMDPFLSYHVQNIRRNDPRETNAFYTLLAILIMCLACYILYGFLLPNGQLCLAKVIHGSAIILHGLTIYWSIAAMLKYNSQHAPYGGPICSLSSTVPLHTFGDPVLKKCFADFHMCQDAILILVGVGLQGLAIVFHFLAVFSAVWECQTQIDPEDWGTIDDLPPEARIPQADPPVYEILTEEEKKQKAKDQKAKEKKDKEMRKEIEKRRKFQMQERKRAEQRVAQEERKKRHEREKIARQEEAERLQDEKWQKKEEEKRLREEERLKRLELRKQWEEEERREKEERRKEKEEKKKQLQMLN